MDNQGQQQQQQQRKRIASIDSRLTNEINQGGQGKVYPPRSSKRGSLRDSSESRSRERGGGGGGGVSETSSGYLAGASSGFVVDSPSSRGGSYWGGIEGNNPSYSGGVSSYGMSGFSSIREGGQGGHFFQPGAGTSGFSFEGGGGGGASYWDGSYRSSITGSPSLFGGGTGARLTSLNLISQNQTQAATSSSDESKLSIQQPWGEIGRGVSPIGRSRAQSPSLVRSESPIGGGRKLKELSRRLRYSIGQPGVTAANRDKGLVGIAKPPKDGNGELGRVAVAGKTCKFFFLSTFPLFSRISLIVKLVFSVEVIENTSWFDSETQSNSTQHGNFSHSPFLLYRRSSISFSWSSCWRRLAKQRETKRIG